MEFTQVVRGRRAVRNYRPTSVERTLVESLIELAVQAPSSMNLQPWAFTVIAGVTRIEEYATLAKQYFLAHEDVPNTMRAMLEAPDYNIFHGAPALVLVIAKVDTAQAREDCCLAAQTLMLAARDCGLGSCWVGFGRSWLNRPEARAMLKLPHGSRVVAPIVLGYPVEWPPCHGRTVPDIHWFD